MKAFDTVNQQALCSLIQELVSLEKFTELICSLNGNTKVWVCVYGELLEPGSIKTSMKQRDHLESKPLVIFFAVILIRAFAESGVDIYVHYRISGTYLSIYWCY